MSEFLEKEINNHFKNRKPFTRKELYDFYLEYKPDINERTFGWRIYELKKKNIIRSVGKGVYTLSGKPEYKPSPSDSLKKINKLMKKVFLDIKYSIWETSWFNEFSNHQITANFIVLDIEKELLNSVFYALRDKNINDLYLQPTEKEIEIYVMEKVDPVILRPLITRSPVQKIYIDYINLSIPTLEKMLTDLFCDRHIFYFYSGAEMKRIFENALDRYTIDFSRLFAYANRRGKEEEIKNFIVENFNPLLEGIAK
ncbi:hypothetical protein H6S82_01440 [Planktothrix sp. FACHB-1355]|uniref:DUF6577 family protein n=1 Tax=Planktothrix sp. FACHB-1355 TaxID=2692854 RepID=UPI00168ADBDB|nr:DUF6577 family protein [Planktothrix sp. FACHB-1355]MBD3557531.1 hypothetical protein [Planktothrix sp. FACHB-1355]MBD3885889.1 hypothetical protein [Phormidium tenue FACHB-886]